MKSLILVTRTLVSTGSVEPRCLNPSSGLLINALDSSAFTLVAPGAHCVVLMSMKRTPSRVFGATRDTLCLFHFTSMHSCNTQPIVRDVIKFIDL